MAQPGFKRLITFQDILNFLSRYVKYWMLACFCVILGCLLSLGYFVYGKPSYYSKSSVEWSYLDLPIKSEVSDVRGNTKWDSIYVQVLGGLQSKWLVERTALRLGLVKSVAELGSIWTKYFSKIKVTPTVGSYVEIEVWVYEPRLARIWPQAMLLEYHDFLTETRIKHRDNVVKGFTKEMDRIRENLQAETDRDRRFESENQILENYVANNKLEQLPMEMLTTQTQVDAMQELVKFIEATAPSNAEKLALLKKYRSTPLALGTIVRRTSEVDPFLTKTAPFQTPSAGANRGVTAVGDTTVVAPVVAQQTMSLTGGETIVTPLHSGSASGWEGLVTELNAKEAEFRQMSASLLPGHEKMRELQIKIDQLNFFLGEEWQKQFSAFTLERDHLLQRLETLKQRMPDYRKLIAGYDDFRRDYRLQSSGRLAWEQAYVNMKGRLSAMEYTGPEVMVEFDFKGFTDVRDQIPVTPNKQKLLSYALTLSVALGVGAPVLAERLRFTSSFVGEAERYSQYPACGIVPLMEGDMRLLPSVSDGDDDKNRLNHSHEVFRLIRTSLAFHGPVGSKHQVIMVTSARPEDGKSTVAAHLAKSYADAGEKVVLLDCDLRRGSLHRLFGLDRSVGGIVEILEQKVSWQETVKKVDVTNFTFISKGKSNLVKIDCLGSEQFQALLDSLRCSFDRIIVDTPPLLGIADSLLISKVVDGVIFVIRADQTTQRDVVTASEILHQSGAHVYGFVLNCVNMNRIENSYYYGSYYSRYYEPTYYSANGTSDGKNVTTV